MASIIPGYEYDVFISYRQNDNKYDSWVTSFVHNLTLELEATSKLKISVYFDVNPQDGLLETDSVGRSIEEKLKCLIFIPVISKTYCDEASFAWQNEFCAFNSFAKGDRFGRDIKLTRGNFSSRLLPVRIHELEHDDIKLLENELGGPLRSIDFIYKSAGVNRPLRANEDHPQDNIYNTYYRDQINKVANAIAELVSVLKQKNLQGKEEELSAADYPKADPDGSVTYQKHKKITILRRAGFWFLTVGLLIILGVFLKFIYPLLKTKSGLNDLGFAGHKISLAIMPFHNLTNDTALNYLGVGVPNGIATGLTFYNEDFSVRRFDLVNNIIRKENISDFSVITVSKGSSLSRKIGADYFILGDILKTENVIYITAQLINVKTEEILKSFKAGGTPDRITDAIESIPRLIRDFLLIEKIQQDDPDTRTKRPYGLHYLSSSPEAYRCHILAFEALNKLDYYSAIRLDSIAVALDSNYIGSIITLSWSYFSVGKYEEAKKLMMKAYAKRDRLPLIEQFSLDFQYASYFQSPAERIKYLQQIIKFEDKDPNLYLMLAYFLVNQGKYEEAISQFEKAQEIFKKWGFESNDLIYYHYLTSAYHKAGLAKKEKAVIKSAEADFNKGDNQTKSSFDYLKMAVIYADAEMDARSDEYFNKAISTEPENPLIYEIYASALIDNNINIDKALEVIEKAIALNPSNGNNYDTKGWGLYRKGKYDEALGLIEKAYEMVPIYDIRAHLDSVKLQINRKI